MGEKTIIENRRARHDYHILDRIEAGISLMGTEVKSLRATNSMQLVDSFADVRNGEAYLVGAHIQPYDKGNLHNHPATRQRKLLMHKQEILRLGQRCAEKGLTLIPLRVYFKQGIVKVELGVCKGKKTVDKRDAINERESKREIDRAVKNARRG